MNSRITGLLSVLVVLSELIMLPTQATEAPQLVLKMDSGLQAGALRDGTRIGRGMMISYVTHTGFQVWCELPYSRNAPSAHYILSGKQNAGNQLRIRLQPAPPVLTAEIQALKGMVVNTRDNQLVFDVLADGDQLIQPDIYALEIKSTLLLP